MEIFNRKLNMINIAGLIILLLLVKHTTSATVASTTKISTTTSKITATTLLTTGPTTNSSTTPSKSPSVNTSLTTKVEVSATTVTTSPTTITTLPTTKAPDECYEISCRNKVNCTVNVDNLVIVPDTVKKCTRKSKGSCYAKRTVDSTKANITNYALGCSAVKCDGDKLNINVTGTVNVTIGCCQGNLCNGVSEKSDGPMVNYNLLLSVICIFSLTMIKG